MILAAAAALTVMLALAGPAGAVGPRVRWQATNPLAGAFTSGISFVDAEHGWLCGADGIVAGTADGGQSWSTASTGWLVSDIQFVSRSTGWVVGSWGGPILRSADGGGTWDLKYTSTTYRFRAVDAVDGDRVWACGDGVVVSSADGGATWTTRAVGAQDLVDIDFSDGDHGWVMDGYRAYRTDDGGESWQALEENSPVYYPSSVSSPSRDCVVIASYNVIAFSRDDGATWNVSSLGDDTQSIRSVYAVDADYAWALTSRGQVWVTGDGGRTWSRQSTAASPDLTYWGIIVLGQRGYVSGAQLLVTERSGYGGDVVAPTTAISLDPAPAPLATTGVNAPTTFTFTPSDDMPGTLATYFRLDGGVWQPGLVALLDAPADHSNDGPHTVEVSTVDAAGNDEVGPARTYFVDTRAPTLTATPDEDDMMGYWINHESVVRLTAHDPTPSSGVQPARLYGARWSPLSPAVVTISAPASHAKDGRYEVRVRAVDGAGNMGPEQAYFVGIDTRVPTPVGPASCSVRRGRTAVVRFRVNDKSPCAGVAVAGFVLLKKSGRVAAQYWPRKWYKANAAQTYSFKCRLARGRYTLLLYCSDGAGNVNKRPDRAPFTVK
jgi:photosystem II stability/assembly factor-like uncharacterized protein